MMAYSPAILLFRLADRNTACKSCSPRERVEGGGCGGRESEREREERRGEREERRGERREK
jgi:hypothetical protein